MDDEWIPVALPKYHHDVLTIQPLRDGGFALLDRDRRMINIYQIDDSTKEWKQAEIHYTKTAIVKCIADVSERCIVVGPSVGSPDIWARQDDFSWKRTPDMQFENKWVHQMLCTAAGDQIIMLCQGYGPNYAVVCDLRMKGQFCTGFCATQCIRLGLRHRVNACFQTQDGDVVIGTIDGFVVLSRATSLMWEVTKKMQASCLNLHTKFCPPNAFYLCAPPGSLPDHKLFWHKDKHGEFVPTDDVSGIGRRLTKCFHYAEVRLDDLYTIRHENQYRRGGAVMAQINETTLAFASGNAIQFDEQKPSGVWVARQTSRLPNSRLHLECIALYDDSVLVLLDSPPLHNLTCPYVWTKRASFYLEDCRDFMGVLAMLV